MNAAPIRAVFVGIVIAALAACSTTHLATAGDEAWRRGDAARALSNWRQARRYEGHLMSRQGRGQLERNIADAVGQLALPALQAASEAVDDGKGKRGLRILLPLYAGRGLYKNLHRAHLATARGQLKPLIGEAIAAAAGVNLKMLAQGQGAVNSASERVKGVRRLIEREVGSRLSGPLVHMLENVARPALRKGWQLVAEHLKAARTAQAIGRAQTLALVFPKDRALQRKRAAARSRAAAHHRKRAATYRGRPGLAWAHHALAARYGGGRRAADTIRNRLRAVSFRVTAYSGCGEMGGVIRGALQRGNSGIPITAQVRVTGCRSRNRSWTTKKRVSWLEWRTRQIKVREWYTAYENKRKCRYVQVYANTTCTTRYVGNGMSRRTCRPNYSSMQRCTNVSVPVRRQRTVTKTQRYQVRLSLLRTISWYETALQVAGQAVISWPGGSRTVPFSYRNGARDHGFSDRAGRRNARRVPAQSMRSQAAGQLASRVHGLHNAALQPKAAELARKAQAAATAGDKVAAADLGLQAWLVGGRLVGTGGRQLAELLVIPIGVASKPGGWMNQKGRIAYRHTRSKRRRRRRYGKRRRGVRLPQDPRRGARGRPGYARRGALQPGPAARGQAGHRALPRAAADGVSQAGQPRGPRGGRGRGDALGARRRSAPDDPAGRPSLSVGCAHLRRRRAALAGAGDGGLARRCRGRLRRPLGRRGRAALQPPPARRGTGTGRLTADQQQPGRLPRDALGRAAGLLARRRAQRRRVAG